MYRLTANSGHSEAEFPKLNYSNYSVAGDWGIYRLVGVRHAIIPLD
jgi:hypothetical protein